MSVNNEDLSQLNEDFANDAIWPVKYNPNGGIQPQGVEKMKPLTTKSMMDWLYPRVGNTNTLMVPNPLYLDAQSNESNKTDSTPPSEEST